MISTEAWVIHRGKGRNGSGEPTPAELVRETYEFSDISEDEVLIEPIYGSWEGNMTHAVERRPVDVCLQRREERVVLGNAGVARVLKPGARVKGLKEGDICMLAGTNVKDQFGFMIKANGYDSPHTIGLLAKRSKALPDMLVPVPENTRFSLKQWAAFPIRYGTAWSNWKKSYSCFRAFMTEQEIPAPHVWGWGGGVTLAELQLAKFDGCQVAMIASKDERLETIRQSGIKAIDRRLFRELDYDEERYESNSQYKRAFLAAERAFLDIVRDNTEGQGVSIFMDYIGTPVIRSTLKALGRPGIITTAGWKWGMKVSFVRAIECINWHMHIHTHFARPHEMCEAVEFAERTGWMPTAGEKVYGWDDIPRLAQDHASERINSYFPVYQVNSL
jgi:NADPH:quinone reductase-like Zn-dependent oxidoreductase